MERHEEHLQTEATQAEQAGARSGMGRTGLLLGLAAGALALAWGASKRPKERRFADRSRERRNPLHFFLAGNHPRRRAIDRSGQRPLFERRQSVYDAY